MLELFEKVLADRFPPFFITHLNTNITQRSEFIACRAAAHSKLGNYTEATSDCERAIGIDPTYSKAYGRMGLGHLLLTSHFEINCSLHNIFQKWLLTVSSVVSGWHWQLWTSIQRQLPTSRKLWYWTPRMTRTNPTWKSQSRSRKKQPALWVETSLLLLILSTCVA